jgi:LPXTG-motif cell wall-anchored protein
MKKPIHIKPQNRLFAVAVAVVFLISFTLLGLCQLDAAAFYGTLYGSRAGVDEDTGSEMPEALEPGEVWAGKNVTKHSDVLTSGKFDVELSALGCDYETESSENLQYDVVFVLDASSSMDTGGKLGTMIDAANNAIDILLSDAVPSDGIYNRVAVITFNQGATVLSGSWTTEGSTYNIGSVSTSSATNMQQGLYLAESVLGSARPAATPVIILLSDGAPNRHAAYNFGTGSPTWVNGTPFDAYGADNSSVYTILYASWLKTQIPNLEIYTVGYDVASSSRAQAVLNPAGGLTAGISDLLDAARTTTGVTAGVGYSDGYYAASINDLSSILPSLTGGIVTSGPIVEDLVITDSIPSTFTVDAASFILNGSSVTLDSGNAYEDPVTHEGVLFDTANNKVVFTIPADALAKYYGDNESEAPNTLKFTLSLNNSATGTGTKYYTDSSCTARFSPTLNNPFYGYVEQSTSTETGSESYINTEAVSAHWGEPGTPVVTEPDWSCTYSKESGDPPVVSSVTVDGVTYTDGSDGAEITVGPRDGHDFPVTVTQDTEVPESVKTHTEISFTFDPADGTHTAFSPLTCQYDYDNHTGSSNDKLDIDFVTVNGITYDDAVNFSCTGSNADYVVTVLDGSTEITAFDLEFSNSDVTDAVFTFDSPAQKSVTTTLWVPDAPAVTEFTVDTAPTDVGTTAEVTVTAADPDVTYFGTVTAFISDTSWTFTQTVPADNITTVYTVTRCGDTLTVAFVKTVVTPAHWSHEPGIDLPETGWIILAKPTVTTEKPPTDDPPTDDPPTTQPPTTQPPTTQPPTTQPPTTQPPTTQPPTAADTSVAGDTEKLPQTGGISSSTLIGLFGLALIISGGTAVTILKKRGTGKSK